MCSDIKLNAMSYVNLTTLADHKRQEMEDRIHMFTAKCDNTIKNLEYLKKRAQGLMTQLNCDHMELKDRFLNSVKTLEEYSYLINDINIAVEELVNPANRAGHPGFGLVNMLPPSISPFNIADTLSQPVPSTSKTCLHPQDWSKKKNIPKDQPLISFSTESLGEIIPSEDKQCDSQTITEGVKNITFADAGNVTLPAQTVLQLDYEYPAVLLHVDGTSFWVTTENIDEAFQLMTDMTEYYKKCKVQFSLNQLVPLSCCAVYEESDSYTRGLFIQLSEEDIRSAQVHLVDYGETRLVPTCWLQPLMPQFCGLPPFARYCHLAGVEIDYEDAVAVRKVEKIMKMHLGRNCTIYVDDNNSESLGVYVLLENGEKINDMVLKAISDKTNNSQGPDTPEGFPGLTEENCDITQIPEYEDPVIAVTGYHNRDEADICKHYKGGPEKTCFKGKRCTKKHVVKHPDGWTLDRVFVPAKLKSLPLPAAGSFVRVLVSHVPHFNHFFVQMINDTKDITEKEFQPLTSLSALVQDMNSAATISSYRPLKMIPAPGELVASLYPMDGKWYRAKVLTSTKADRKVEIKYVDYGNVIWVDEDLLRELQPRFCVLPTQAILCILAGITLRNQAATNLIAGRNALIALIQDKRFDAEVIATDYDSITVVLYDEKGNNIADLLALQKVVERQEYTIDYKLTDGRRYVIIPS
ncbi:tudor domain-containing protein 1-like isoform X1 [Pieris brassicae]|uniref:tudor domain-containing protein 1-like isoform X1 n=2 Tax=Pieris brassicae TaxID=7116 RepID=UPI001E65F994|nr:tudor domain-containing protein 1-like isoform X1 [Pieris brassicae]